MVIMNKIPSPRQRPPWPEIVELMYDRSLSFRDAEVIRVIYSADREKRLIITKSETGYYQYHLERLYAFDDEEWFYLSQRPDALPAMWDPFGRPGTSYFGTEQDLWNEITCLPEYKTYFAP